MFKNISTAVITTFILLTAVVAGVFSHQNHGGVEVDEYLVDVQPKVFTAGRPIDFFVLIDYKINETEVPGLVVKAEIKAVGSEGFEAVACREVAAGQYLCTHGFERGGEYLIVVRFDSLSAIFPVTVKAAEDWTYTALPNILLIAFGGVVAAIFSLKVLKSDRIKKRLQT